MIDRKEGYEMALSRNVRLSFWTDSKVIDDFTPEDRYFFLYLMTNPHTNLCGCYEISKKQVSDETGYTKEVIEKLIKRMSDTHNVIRYSEQTKELIILNWGKYNWTDSSKLRIALEREVENVKDAEFKRFLTEMMNADDTVSIPYPYTMDNSVYTNTLNTNTLVANTNTEKKKKKEKEPKHRYGEYNHVTLTDKEYNTLAEEYGEQMVLLAIKNMDEWCEMKGKTYKSFYLALRKWGMKAVSERSNNGYENRTDNGNNNTNTEQGTGASVSDDPFEGMSEEQKQAYIDMCIQQFGYDPTETL
jgi:hypothetical protein